MQAVGSNYEVIRGFSLAKIANVAFSGGNVPKSGGRLTLLLFPIIRHVLWNLNLIHVDWGVLSLVRSASSGRG